VLVARILALPKIVMRKTDPGHRCWKLKLVWPSLPFESAGQFPVGLEYNG